MRIVGGTLGGRRFSGPPGDTTRPTSERVREAIASALASRGAIEDALVLDLYAGTGALAFEALSRGARMAVLVERDARVVRALKTSVSELGLESRARVEALDLGAATSGLVTRLRRHTERFTLVFADPPYSDVDRAPIVVSALASAGLVHEDTLVVLEHARKQPPKDLGSLACLTSYEYGDTSVAFLTVSASAATNP